MDAREQGQGRGALLVLQMEKPESRGGRAWQCRARPSPWSLYLVTFFGRQTPVRKVLFASWSPILTEQVLGVQPQVLVREGQRLVWLMWWKQ